MSNKIPGFEIKWDFGQDSQRIMEMIYLMEHFPAFRCEILKQFVLFSESNEAGNKSFYFRIPETG